MELSNRYSASKVRLKRLIQQNIEQWFVIGETLRQIKESGDWKQEFKTWAEFCSACCDFTKRHADKLISDASAFAPIKEAFAEMGTNFPIFSQKLAREVGKMDNEEDRVEVAKAIVAANPTKPVVRSSRKTIVLAPVDNPLDDTPKVCPTCKQTIC